MMTRYEVRWRWELLTITLFADLKCNRCNFQSSIMETSENVETGDNDVTNIVEVQCEDYLKDDLDKFGAFESQDYLPPHSDSYLKWLKQQSRRRSNWDKWVMMGMIGLVTGLTGFFLHQFIDLIADTKWRIAKHYISQSRSDFAAGWITSLLFRKITETVLQFSLTN